MVDYSHRDCERNSSEGATRNIVTWLRGTERFLIAERDIREHEWIDNFEESDDECHDPEGNGWKKKCRGWPLAWAYGGV
jgi:hypothetical protein